MMPERRFGPITIEFDHTCDDQVSAALSMLAHGLSKLSADEREKRLQGIEDGALRKAVSGFVATRPYRQAPNHQRTQ